VRQSRIRNLAVKYSRTPYLIFIDHDVILHNDFILDHLSKAEDGCFLQGKRVLLSERYTQDMIKRNSFSPPSLWSKSIGNRKNLIHSKWLSNLLARPKSFDKGIRSCNLSMFKSDFIEVDGFDEIYDKSWGREDSDLCYRLFHAGITIKILWFTAIQYHLKHGVDKWDKERLDRELQQVLDEKRIKAKKGLSRISPEGGIIASSKDRVES
jgi:glycosyltransferase involved in cell wall biosynthesis